jgi:hypothetical protein
MLGLRNPASEAGWNSLLPVCSFSFIHNGELTEFKFGRGYIFVADPSTYSFPPGETALNGHVYSVALYHELHCLNIIRRDYFNLLDAQWLILAICTLKQRSRYLILIIATVWIISAKHSSAIQTWQSSGKDQNAMEEDSKLMGCIYRINASPRYALAWIVCVSPHYWLPE